MSGRSMASSRLRSLKMTESRVASEGQHTDSELEFEGPIDRYVA